MTTKLWNRLFLTSNHLSPNDTAGLLREALNDLGYEEYNPFGLIPGKSYQNTVRLFVAPVVEGWIHIVTDTPIPDSVVSRASRGGICLMVRLEDEESSFSMCADEHSVSDIYSALLPYVRPGKTHHDLRSALSKPEIRILSPDKPEAVLPVDMLSEDVQRMAGQIDPDAANKLFAKMAGNVFGKTGGSVDSASAILNESKGPDWNSPGGWKIQALMDVLSVSARWREPEFVTLRDAYALHARRSRNPNARLYPGDAEAMAAVPNALDYFPVYGGKDA